MTHHRLCGKPVEQTENLNKKGADNVAKTILGRYAMVGLLLVAVSFGLGNFTATSQSDQPLTGVRVDQATSSGANATPMTQVFRMLLERLGAEVELSEVSSGSIAYTALSLGDIDFRADAWFPLHESFLPDGFRNNASIFDAHCPDCGLQGYIIDIDSIKKFNITSLEDFRGNFEMKSAFDANGDLRADLFGCPTGTGCHEVIENHLSNHDLRGAINHRSDGFAENFSRAMSRIDNGQPTLLYTFSPSSRLSKLSPGEDVQWVNVVDDADDLQPTANQSDFSKDALIAEGLGNKAVSDPVNLGFLVSDLTVAANDDFLDSHPAAEELFKQVRLPLQWINEAAAAIEDGGADARELAEQWIVDNADKTEEWLNAARSAGN